MKILKIALLTFSLISIGNAQTDQEVLKTIYTQSLTDGKSYDWLNYLSNQIGSRLSGSLGAEKAVAYTKEELIACGAATKARQAGDELASLGGAAKIFEVLESRFG